MKNLILLLVVAAGVTAQSAEARTSICDRHPIYCHIKRLNPEMAGRDAMNYSNTVYQAAEYYNLDPREMVAIVQQESGWDDTVAVVVHKNGSIDLGMTQINENTARHYKINIPRLLSDPHYSIWAQAKILKKKIRVCLMRGLPASKAWSCYNSYTEKYRKKYERLTRRWM